MRKTHDTPAGTLHRLHITSDALKNNMLGDPHVRDVVVYTPAGHDGRDLPLLVDIVGYTGSGLAHVGWKNFGENVPERLDRLIHNGDMPPVAVAFPDCFTRLGGNQYINSAAMGNWQDFLINDMVPAVEAQFACGGMGKRGIFGKSSGGYGSMVHAMLHADFWSAAACHSGDMAFDLCYLSDMPKTLRALAKRGGTAESYMTYFEALPKIGGDDVHTLMILAMAATYDPDPDAFLGIRLPVDLDTCDLIPDRWANWTRWDPLVMVDQHLDDLKQLKGLWIDCGDVDQYDLVYGARRMHRKLDAAGVTHIYEEFPDDHSSIDYRLDRSLPYLARTLSD